MSNRGRAGVIALAVAIVVVAFVALKPTDDNKKSNDQKTSVTNAGGSKEPTATAPSAPAPPREITLKGGVPQGGIKSIKYQKGDDVRLLVITDEKSDQLHLHGYDIEKSREGGQAGQLSVQGQDRGRLRAGEPHRRARGPRAPDRADSGRALLMLVIAHGIVGRKDLPIPEWLFGWAAAVVLVVSFVALAVLWPQPRLQDGGFVPLPERISRVLTSRVLEVVCGAIGVGLLFLVVYSGLSGIQVAMGNFASEFVLVLFWVGLVPVSILLGDVFRAFNPWRALARFVAGVSQAAARGPLPAPLAYPERLGYLPAAAGLVAFTALELVSSTGSQPRNVAIATLVYSALTFVAMALYGVEEWSRKGEAFGVYFGLFARISPWTRRGKKIGLRKPLSGLAEFEALPGSVLLLSVMIGTVTFDGAGEGPLWTSVAPHLQSFFESVGLSPEKAQEGAFFIGLCAGIALVYGLYRLGIAGAASVGGNQSARKLGRTFVHTLVPIATAYVMAHYLTYLVEQGQSIKFLVSNPLGHEGTDIFGTANEAIVYGVIGASAVWYYQVAFVVAGHVAALTLAHDRALVTYDEPRLAVRSQYWMLVIMVCFTSLALWLLAQANG